MSRFYSEEKILELLRGGWISTPEVAEAVGCSLPHAHRMLSSLKGVESKGKRPKLWRLKEASASIMRYKVLRELFQRSYSSRMFNIVTKTWNPVTGCEHFCKYCWARRSAETKLKSSKRYRKGFTPSLNLEEFGIKFHRDNVFVTDMGDIFGDFIPDEWIERVLRYISAFQNAMFLFLTKNPMRYARFLEQFPESTILGATIETDSQHVYDGISKAPPPEDRIKAMASLDWHYKLISIEPILKFSSAFPGKIKAINPSIVYIGYDNYRHNLPEPRLSDTLSLIRELESGDLLVLRKSIRRSWDEWYYRVAGKEC